MHNVLRSLHSANDGQVDANGFSWRSGAKVEKVKLKQWFLRITAFKESLLADLDSLAKDNRWPERVLSMQYNWLGRSRGATVKFEILHGQDLGASTQVKVFTTRPDTLFGAQYVALALDHPLVVSLSESNSDLKAFINRAPSLPLDSKEGFLLPGVYASNPLSILTSSPDRTRIALPVYAAPYVLGSYGEGAIMGVPGHDGRDHAFWKQNCGDEAILRVVDPVDSNGRANVRKRESRVAAKPFEGSGKLNWLCGKLSGFSSAQASQLIVEELRRTGELAMQVETWRLRDWLISRQRYWGTPIPIIYCESCGTVPVPVDQLPVELPALKGDWFKSKSGNPLEATDEWVNTTCPTCKGKATRETDTMDTFMDSSWYFMRLIDPHNTIHPFSTEAAEKYLPVDIYVGGVEHAILHLLYARFISKFFASTSLWPSGGGEQNKGEPFRRLVSQGMVQGKTFSDPENGRFLKPEEIDLSNPSEPKISSSGQAANISWEKMSKSKYNGVDPTECIRKYGADAARAHILFQAPASEVLNWEEERITGIQRWFARVWRVTQETKHKAQAYDELLTSPSTGKAPFDFPIPDPASFTKSESYAWSQVQRTILSVTKNLSETFTLNTIISDLMELTNTLLQSKEGCNPRLQFHAVSALLRMMAPVTPAVAEECWEELHSIRLGLELDSNNNKEVPIIISPNPIPSIPSIFESPFPTFDSSLAAIESQSQTCVIQENGKWRLAVEIAKPSQELMEEGKEDELREWVLRQIEATQEGRIWSQKKKSQQQHGPIMTWKRIIVVSGGKVVNFVQ